MGYNNAFFALAPYGEYWREMRKIVKLELLSTLRLQQLKHVRDSEILCLVKDLFSTHQSNNNMVKVPMSDLLEHLTFNINVRIIAGKRFSGNYFIIHRISIFLSFECASLSNSLCLVDIRR